MIVVDASAVVELLLVTPSAKNIAARLRELTEPPCAPHLIDVEVAHVFRRYVALGEIDAERGRIALSDLREFPIRKYAHDFLLPRVWELRNNLTAYDATYVALAEILGVPLLTRDRRLAVAAVHRAQIELV